MRPKMSYRPLESEKFIGAAAADQSKPHPKRRSTVQLDVFTPPKSTLPIAASRRQRRRLPVEKFDIVAACNRVLAGTTDPKWRAALEAIAFHVLRARQQGGRR